MNQKPLLFTVAFILFSAQVHYVFKLIWLVFLQPCDELPEVCVMDKPMAS